MNSSRFASLALLWASPAFGNEPLLREFFADAATRNQVGPGGDLLWLWAKVIAFLVFLGAGAALLNYYYRHKRPGIKSARAGRIHLADTCALGNRQYLVVAQFGHERHLLGISPNAISHLSSLRDVESQDEKPQGTVNPKFEEVEGVKG